MTPNFDLELCIRVSLKIIDKQRRIVAYLDSLQAKVKTLRELQSALMPRILDKAFKGEL
jgi:hypothetical protein